MSRLKYAHFCKWHSSRTALSLIDIIWWNLCTDTKAKASSALNSMGNRYFSCLKTPFGRLYYHSCCSHFAVCRRVMDHRARCLFSCLFSAVSHPPFAVCCLPSAGCRLWLSEVARFAVSNCASIVCQVVSYVGLKFASRNSGCSSWEEKKYKSS